MHKNGRDFTKPPGVHAPLGHGSVPMFPERVWLVRANFVARRGQGSATGVQLYVTMERIWGGRVGDSFEMVQALTPGNRCFHAHHHVITRP